jgi:hypothetical protein
LSLIVALAGSREAVIGGDWRSISFFGSSKKLEEELYSGEIRNDQELIARAKELNAILQVSDGREKVWRRGDLLVGEVTEISSQSERRRRIYLAPGGTLVVDITDSEAKITSMGKIGCVVLGNRFTQKLASDEVNKAKGRVNEDLIRNILAIAGNNSASVSRQYTVLRTDVKQSDPKETLRKALLDDCEKSGWRLCGLQ